MKTLKNLTKLALTGALIFGLNSCSNNEKITGKVISEYSIKDVNNTNEIIGSGYIVRTDKRIYHNVEKENYLDIFNVGDSVDLEIKDKSWPKTGEKFIINYKIN